MTPLYIVAGVLAIYVAVTALLIFRRRGSPAWADGLAWAVALVLSIYLFRLGFAALQASPATVDGAPVRITLICGSFVP